MNTALIIIGIVIGSLVFLVFRAKARMKNIPLVADHEKIITLTDKNFQNQTKNLTLPHQLLNCSRRFMVNQ